jgi:N-methylhydantoinase A/oxoprolinase/acetone carboxylase beta subunit
MTERRANLRIGIDTGGTFTDIVCVDGTSGAMRVTKVASTPSNPAIGLVRGVTAILDAGGASVDDLAGLAHGTTVATNALLQGEIAGLGLIVTEGFSHILEIARQAVPEGYGNSYFWVKPERIVPLRYVREASQIVDGGAAGFEDFLDAAHQPDGGVGRRAGDLGDAHGARRAVNADDVGEGAAGVDADTEVGELAHQ